MYSLSSCEKSPPPQNHQLNILTSTSKTQVHDFVGELTFQNRLKNTFCEIKTYSQGGMSGQRHKLIGIGAFVLHTPLFLPVPNQPKRALLHEGNIESPGDRGRRLRGQSADWIPTPGTDSTCGGSSTRNLPRALSLQGPECGVQSSAFPGGGDVDDPVSSVE